MKRSFRASLAAALLLSVSLVGTAQPALAGCSVNVKYVNKESTSSKVEQFNSKVRSKTLGNVWGTWKKLGTTTITVPANGQLTKTYTHTFGCSVQRQYKFRVKNGSNAKTLYQPSYWYETTTSKRLTVTIDF